MFNQKILPIKGKKKYTQNVQIWGPTGRSKYAKKTKWSKANLLSFTDKLTNNQKKKKKKFN